jgi:hypothetical protein
MKTTLIGPLLILVVVLASCSMSKMTLGLTTPLLQNVLPAFEAEEDYEFARAALPGNIKTVEGFIKADPDSEELLLLLAQAYGAYALVFLEDELDSAEEGSETADAIALRVRTMYMRSHGNALKLLEEQESGFKAAFKKGGKALKQALADCDEDEVAGLFWAGMALGSAINVSRNDAAMIYLIPKAKALIQRVIELDERYFFAGGHLVMGVILGGMPEGLGGKPKKAKEHFEKALKLTKRKALLIHVLYAQFPAVQLQDKELFKKLLDEVVKADLEILPDQKLMNVAAKRRAKRLLARMDRLF